MNPTKTNLIDEVLDLVAMLDKGDDIATKVEVTDRAQAFGESYKGSSLDLFLVAKRIADMADELLTTDLKENAYTEFTIRYGDEKAQHRGNNVTPIRGYAKYEYPQDNYIDKVQGELDELKTEMKPLKDKEKSMKGSIKERKSELVSDGKATKISERKSVRG